MIFFSCKSRIFEPDDPGEIETIVTKNLMKAAVSDKVEYNKMAFENCLDLFPHLKENLKE